jgi:hypothetical protein
MKKSWLVLCLVTAALLGVARAEAAEAPSLLVCSDASVYNYDAVSGNFIGIFATGGGMTLCYGEVFGPDGNLYVADFPTGNILKFNGQMGAFIESFATAGANNATGVAFGPDGNLYVGNNTNTVQRYNGSTGALIGTFITGPSDFAFGGMVFNGGSVFVSWIGGTGGSLVQYSASTGAQVSTIFSSFGNGNGPRAGVFGPNGNLYVPVWQSPDVALFNGTTFAFIGNVIVDSSLSPNSIAFGPGGEILALNDQSSDTVRAYSQTGTFLSTLVAAGSGGLGRGTQILYVAPVAPTVPATGRYGTLLAVALLLAGLAMFRYGFRRPSLAR